MSVTAKSPPLQDRGPHSPQRRVNRSGRSQERAPVAPFKRSKSSNIASGGCSLCSSFFHNEVNVSRSSRPDGDRFACLSKSLPTKFGRSTLHQGEELAEVE